VNVGLCARWRNHFAARGYRARVRDPAGNLIGLWQFTG
jgi:hypothetical protein